ncbi:MAG: hypothetical protein HRF43_20255 [Phycisphaerae bacterium]|jgi:hypothetical protein
MAIMCRVELFESRGKVRGLTITHPDMGLVMDWGSKLPTVNVRLVPQEIAFQMMADVERYKTQRLERELYGDNGREPSGNHAAIGFFSALEA